jgi:hypothetical protein
MSLHGSSSPSVSVSGSQSGRSLARLEKVTYRRRRHNLGRKKENNDDLLLMSEMTAVAAAAKKEEERKKEIYSGQSNFASSRVDQCPMTSMDKEQH